jgi:hypothetical protein
MIIRNEHWPYIESIIALDDETLIWCDAIDAIEVERDPKPLIEMLLTRPVPPSVNPFLADLIRRRLSKEKRGNRHPLYLLKNPQTAQLSVALMRYWRLRDEGLSRIAAIDRTVSDMRRWFSLHIARARLEQAINSDHSSLRRARDRRRSAV